MTRLKKIGSLNWWVCLGLSHHGSIRLLHPTRWGFLQRKFQWLHLSRFTPRQLYPDLFETILHNIFLCSDSQRTSNSIGKYLPATTEFKKTLNKNLRVPEKLVLYEFGLYECSTNGPNGCYNQSSLALLLDLPTLDTVESFQPITMWIAPAGTTDLDFTRFHNGRPTQDQLIGLEWIEVRIGCAAKQIVICRGGYHAKHVQYALKHCGALTINKAQGYTVHHVAVEISPSSAPC